MHYAIIFSTIALASAAPLLNTVSSVVDSVETTVEQTTGGIVKRDSLVGNVVTAVNGVVSEVGLEDVDGIVKRSPLVGTVVTEVNGVISEVGLSGTVNGLTKDLPIKRDGLLDTVGSTVDSVTSTVDGLTGGLVDIELPVKRDELLEGVTDTVDEVTSTVNGLVKGLPVSVPVKREELLDTVTGTLGEVTSTVDGVVQSLNIDVPALPVKRDITNTVGTLVDDVLGHVKARRDLLGLSSVTGLLQTAITTVSNIDAKLGAIIGHAKSLDVDAILGDVVSEADDLLNTVQSISNSTGLGLNLAAVTPLVGTVITEVTSLLATVDTLLGDGIAGNAVNDVKSTLGSVLDLLNGLSL